jgi:hypothetical protein
MIHPKVSCLCPTRGRFDTLRESLAFFLLQDYSNKEMIVFNNHPEPMAIHPKLIKHNIKVINAGDYSGKSMQKIYSDALQYVSHDSEYIAIWDDDDMYFPWHLSDNMNKLISSKEKLAIRPAAGYWQDINNATGIEYSFMQNNLEAGMIARKDIVFFNSGINDTKSEHYTHPHLLWTGTANSNNHFILNDKITAVYRWGYGKSYAHLQSAGPHRNNSDTGINKALTPKGVSSLFFDFLHKCSYDFSSNKVLNFDSDRKAEFLLKLLSNNIYMYDHVDKYKAWLYWDSKNIPQFIKECNRSIQENTFAKVEITDDDYINNVLKIKIPDKILSCGPQQKADYIRIYLLNYFGGWWFDADTYVVGDLDKYYFNFLTHNETVFPWEYNIVGNITTPILSSKPHGLIIREAYNNIHEFLKTDQQIGWSGLGINGIIKSAQKWKDRIGWNLFGLKDIATYGYNNNLIDKWDFSNMEASKLQMIIFHWSQIGAELNGKIKENPTTKDIIDTYPNLEKLFNLSKQRY